MCDNAGTWTQDITVRKPFKEWVSAEDEDIGLLLGVEALRAPDMYQPLQMCQWAVGGKAGNPLSAQMLDFISYRQAPARSPLRLQLCRSIKVWELCRHGCDTPHRPCQTHLAGVLG